MTDRHDWASDANDASDPDFDRRLEALMNDAAADAPAPPDFHRSVSTPRASVGSVHSIDNRRVAVGIGAGILAAAAALALFVVVPGRGDDSLVVSDADPIATPDSIDVTAPVTPADSGPDFTPAVEAPSPTAVVTSDTTPTTSVLPTTTASAPETSEPAATAVASPTVEPTTLPPTTVLPIDTTTTTAPADVPIDVVDVAGGTVFGIRLFDEIDVDAAAAQVSARLGAPTLDDGWQPMADQVECTGATEYRVIWWGDVRMTFERYQTNGRDELTAWSVGEPELFGFVPIGGEIPPPIPSRVVTLEGIGLGSTRADVEATWANLNQAGGGRFVVIDRGGSLTITFDADDRVAGFGAGPFDCPSDEPR